MHQSTSGTNEPNMAELLLDVRRCIAISKIREFKFQTFRLGDFVRIGLLASTTAAELLYDAALANGLVEEHGDDVIQALMAQGLTTGTVDDRL
jgi:hypothetical protein